MSPHGLPVFILCALFVMGGQGLAAPLTFNFAPRHQIGLNTIDTVYADLDGDGLLDITTVNGGEENPSPTITILFGTANGEFSAPLVLPSYMIGQTIAVGDLNHDGKPDIVAGSWYQNALAVFLNQGNRQFTQPVFSIPPDPPYPTGLQVGEFFDLAIGDFDGDGNNDVVALQDQINQRLRFFHFNGNGTLTVFATINQNETGTSYERVMEVGDLNGDNRPDIVFAGGGPFGVRNISFVFGQPVGGTLALSYGPLVEDKTVGISINDLDNDGDKDLAVAFLDTTTPNQNSLRVFRNNGSGSFTSVPRSSPDYLFPPNDITTGDFNNDGKQDLAALISETIVTVMYGNGDLSYSGEKNYLVSASSSIHSGDFNSDNKTDLITTSSFLLQTDYSQYVGLSNNTVNILFNDNLQRFKSPPVTLWGPNFIDAGDFNSDGYKDLVSSWATTFNNTSGVDILLNDTAGGLLPEVDYQSPGALNGMKTGDFNGDGKLDAVSAHAYTGLRLAVYFGSGNGTLSAPVSTSFTEGLSNLIVGDFNSDGKDDVFIVDVASRGYAMLSNGNGTFSVAPNSPMTLPDSILEFQKGDFNGDHKLDLIISRDTQPYLWLGDGAGRFTQSSVTIPALAHVVPGDFNGDGKLDLAGTAGSGITGILGDGSGGFAGSFSKPIEGTYLIQLTRSIVAADFDRDGFDDIALTMRENTFGSLIVIPSGGSAPSWKQPLFYGAGAIRTLIATDFNNDGKPDLGYVGDNVRGVIYNTTGTRSSRPQFDYDGDGKADISNFRPSSGVWYIQNSADSTYFIVQFGIGSDRIVPADYDGDGKTNVGIFRESNGLWYWLRSSDGVVAGNQFGLPGDKPVPQDYDGDGKANVAIFRPSTGTWWIYRSSDNQAQAVSFGIAEDIPTPGTFDGDNKADIAVYRPSTGVWYRLNSSDGQFVVQQFGASGDKPVPADYDGDGRTDIAVFRPGNGAWYRLLSGSSAVSGVTFGQNGDMPVAADYDGDGKADAAVFRPSEARWYVLGTTAGFTAQAFGTSEDRPTPNAFVP